MPLPSSSCHFHRWILLRAGIHGRPCTAPPELAGGTDSRHRNALDRMQAWEQMPRPQEEGCLGLCADVATRSQCDLGQVLLFWGRGERVMDIMQAPLPASNLQHWEGSALPVKHPGSPNPAGWGGTALPGCVPWGAELETSHLKLGSSCILETGKEQEAWCNPVFCDSED